MGTNHSTAPDRCDTEPKISDYSNLQPFLNLPKEIPRTSSVNMNTTMSSSDFEVDAAITSNSLRIRPIKDQNQISVICELLDEYEKISIIYLVATDYRTAFDLMLKVCHDNNQFAAFLNDQLKAMDSTKKFIEALCVIQNYEVLKLLEYDKSELIVDFTPLRYHCAIYINKARKLCYRVMENLTEKEEKNLLQSIKEDLQESNEIQFPNYKYLEMYLAFLFVKNYISDTDRSNLVKHFKAMELDKYVDILQNKKEPAVNIVELGTLSHHSGSQVNTDKTTANIGSSDIAGTSHISSQKVNIKPLDVYPIDENNPGLVLIIENIDFYEDFTEEYEHLVIKSKDALEARAGSENDSKRLRALFKRFGFEVIYETNKTHTQMIEIITDCSHNKIKKHSSFILVLLSHGQENQIIGCNCVPADVNDIKQSINSEALERKPKILIYQACQGTEFMTVPADDICTDAPKPIKSSHYPWQQHIFELWSAVPGFVSFRSKRKGSWMIQTLCDVLESEYRRESFADICAEVNRRISECSYVDSRNKSVKNIMLTMTNSTLDKKFIFPPLGDPNI